MRVDHARHLLEQYEAPYRVLKHISDNVFLIDIRGKETTISTERLKPAYRELQEKQEPQTYAKGKISSALPSWSSDSVEVV